VFEKFLFFSVLLIPSVYRASAGAGETYRHSGLSGATAFICSYATAGFFYGGYDFYFPTATVL
jgi:hypothetical protein